MSPHFFATPAHFRRWLSRNHRSAGELWVGFWKKQTGRPSLTWPQSVDEALCYGWIDGVRKRIDDDSYMIRFTPRRPGSTWSAVNIKRIEVLTAEGRMHADGLAAFQHRNAERSGIYTYEKALAELPAPMLKTLQRHKTAAKFFESQPPSYRRLAIGWVTGAKQEATRLRRFAQLLDFSARQLRIPQAGGRPAKNKAVGDTPSVDAYIAAAPATVQPILKKIRAVIIKAVPEATEVISYKMPAYRCERIFCYFAAFKQHIGIYPPLTATPALDKALAPYRGDKGNLKFPLADPMPYALIGKVARALAREHGVKK
ncbi:MAG: YdeI/OmpD-associated family protein [Gammaproteobacteria bacterium]|nr:YdeI/OmpD-associated family protein [Gammaproteobacteria bacterium]